VGVLVFGIVAESVSMHGCMKEVNKARGDRSIWRPALNADGQVGLVVRGRLKPYSPPFLMLGLNAENTRSTALPASRCICSWRSSSGPLSSTAGSRQATGSRPPATSPGTCPCPGL